MKKRIFIIKVLRYIAIILFLLSSVIEKITQDRASSYENAITKVNNKIIQIADAISYR